MKNILVINGHPDSKSYCRALTEAYAEGATSVNKNVEVLHVGELEFNPNLQYGYRKRTELEADLIDAQAKLKWADHIVWVFPVWWGSYPAILKGFLDRVLLPGFAFKKREGSIWWDKYFVGKTARIISTLDQPVWYYYLFNGWTSNIAMKRLTMKFIGVKNTKTTTIGPIRLSSDAFRKKWLEKVYQLGRQNK